MNVVSPLTFELQTSLALLIACFLVSAVVAFFTLLAIPKAASAFIKAGLHGVDLSKVGKPVIAESMGAICGLFYMLALFLLIPFLYSAWGPRSISFASSEVDMFASFISAMLSIQSMLFLGFADDVLNIKWRHKLLLPAFASIPLLLMYSIHGGLTHVILPKLPFLRQYFGSNTVDLGHLYYVYMAMVAVFCTNSINILAGINGVEVSQSLVIACSTAVYNVIQLYTSESDTAIKFQTFSLVLLIPFILVSFSLLKYNWYPSRVFVGDTFTYFAGMVLAVCSILGHFSKTMLLLHFPQIFNFLFSVPQLVHLLPCPRHRMPKFNEKTGLLECSVAQVPEKQLTVLGKVILCVASTLHLVEVKIECKEDENMITFTNFTLINSILVIARKTGKIGLNENTLTKIVILVQLVNSLLTFFIRLYLAQIFYS